jgi:hypothetical protein
MKKIYLVALLLSVSCWLSAQTLIYEDFSGGTMPPTGWTIDAHAANWSVEATANAGGTAPEAQMYYDPSFNAISRLISPAIDMTGFTSVKLMFKHFMDDYAGTGYSFGVATRHGAGTWNTVWSMSPTGNVGPELRMVDIANGDVGASDFQFCIYFSGNSYNMDYWYIDDIELFVPYGSDASMTKITTPSYIGADAPVEGVLTNLGLNQITSVDVSWQVADGPVNTTTFSGLAINFSESFNFSCNDLFHYPVGGYLLNVWVASVNGGDDQNPINNLLTKNLSVYSYSTARKPSFEEFTSSTCAPCASFNTSFNPWTEEHAEEITLVKYQMNWPGAGDPYYTAEGGVRRNYYGVSYVPWPQCNGAYVDYTIGAVQAAFDEAITKPGIAKIASTHSLEGTVITVNATILPFANFTDFRAHIIVIENVTTGNVSSNGETEFHHVMMKMMPDANGTVMNMNDRVPVTLTETVDLSGTNIEEFDDLSVVVLFQDYNSKEIFQSEYSGQDAVYNDDAHCAFLTYDETPVPNFDPDKFDYEIELPAGTTDVPVVAGTTVDPYATMVVVPAWELPGTTVVDIFGEDLISHMTYNLNFSVAVGVDEPVVKNNMKVYPNPAKDRIYVSGADNSTIRIFTITGQQVIEIKGFTGNTIDVASLENGVYTVQIVKEDNSVLNSKISIVR